MAVIPENERMVAAAIGFRPLPLTASPFALSYEEAIDAGFHVHAIGPGEKKPQNFDGRWYDAAGWHLHSDKPAADKTIRMWALAPGANIGAAMGSPAGEGFILVGLDVDATDPALLADLLAEVPWSPNIKVGRAPGGTHFFRAAVGTGTVRYDALGSRALELLSRRAQTVLPPSHHKDTGLPYYWKGEGPLVHATELPILTVERMDALRAVLARYGGDVSEVTPAVSPAAGGAVRSSRDGVSPHRAVNDAAMANFDAWVPKLDIANIQPTSGGYKGTAQWRPSNKGNPVEARAPNLSIHARGIVDHGDRSAGSDGKPYTPINLVMASMGWDDGEAFCRLSTWLDMDGGDLPDDLPEKPRIGVPQSAIEGEKLAAARANDNMVALPPKLIWERHGELSPFPEPFWFIKGFLPTEGNTLLAGVSTAGKTFVAIALAVSLATGAPFMGMPIRQMAGCAFIVGEGRSTIRKRLAAAVIGVSQQGYDTSGKLPISFMEASLNQRSRQATVEALKAEKARMKATLGIDMGVIFVDTLAACFEFDDENSSAEATKSMNVLNDIGRELNCLVITTAHHGKKEGAGVRGSTAFTASADNIFTVIAEPDENDADTILQRQVRISKTRDGEIGRRFTFDLTTVEIGEDRDGDPILSAYVVSTEEPPIVHVRAARVERLTQGARAYLQALGVLQSEAEDIAPFGSEGPRVKALNRDRIRREVYASYPADGDTEAKRTETKRKAFANGEKSLIDKNKIVTREVGAVTYIWPL